MTIMPPLLLEIDTDLRLDWSACSSLPVGSAFSAFATRADDP